MERKIILTSDNSHTIEIPELKVTYHSRHGAIAESQHVFIEAGLNYYTSNHVTKVNILEMGFGTGLNALLTLIEKDQQDLFVHYTAIEKFPISIGEAGILNYHRNLLKPGLREAFMEMHECEWSKDVLIKEGFILKKVQTDLHQFIPSQKFNVIYYDAFAPAAQPELWTQDIFKKIADMMEDDAVLVTYCSKGEVRRAIQGAGLKVEKLPGPKGKREMIRVKKG